MPSRASRRWLVCGLLSAWVGLAAARDGHGAEAGGDVAEGYVAELARRIVAALSDPTHGEAERLAEVDRLAQAAFDLDRTARIALGRYWKAASPEQQREFVLLFKDYVLTSYGRRFHAYADRSFKILGARRDGEHVTVESVVEGGPTPIRLDWRLAASGAGWRVLDVSVEGVSLLLTYRSEFAAVLGRHDGRVDSLLDELRRRVTEERARLAT